MLLKWIFGEEECFPEDKINIENIRNVRNNYYKRVKTLYNIFYPIYNEIGQFPYIPPHIKYKINIRLSDSTCQEFPHHPDLHIYLSTPHTEHFKLFNKYGGLMLSISDVKSPKQLEFQIELINLFKDCTKKALYEQLIL